MDADREKCLMKIAPGLYLDPIERKDLKANQEYVLLDDHGLAKLGLGKEQSKTLDRLAYCGCITVCKITPRRKLMLLASWMQHLEAVQQDPEYWEKAEMRRKWRVACLAM